MFPPDSPRANSGADDQPAQAGEAPLANVGAESGAGTAQQAAAQHDGVQQRAAESGAVLPDDGGGHHGSADRDSSGAGDTVSLPAPGPVGRGGTGRGRDAARRALGKISRAAGQARAAAASSLAPVIRTWRRIRPAPSPGGQAARARSADIAGTVLARLTVLPAVLILAWLIPGVPLLLAGHFQPVPMTLISVPLAVALTVNGLRVVPASWPRLMSGARVSGARASEPGWTIWFGLLATVAVVAGLTGWQLTESSQALIVLRDPGTFLQAGYWIAQHGSLPIPETLKAFGGVQPGLHFASTGFDIRGTSIYPAVMPGLPILLAGGFWVHGITGAAAIGPVLGGLATLTFAGLVGRLIGPQWAPAGALVLGLSLPQQYVGRTSLSETALQIVLFGGLCLLADSLALRGDEAPSASAGPARGGSRAASRAAPARLASLRQLASQVRWVYWLTAPRMLAALAGLALSFGLVISLDSLVYLLPVIPFGCALVIGRRPQAAPFLVGIALGVSYGILGCYLLDRPFLDSVGQTVALAGVVAVWLIALSVVIFQLARIGRVRRFVPRVLSRRPLRWLPEIGAAVAVAALIGLAVRPYVQKVHGHPSKVVYDFIASLQRLQGLPVDPTRLYSEQTLYWVIWYIGLPTVLLGAFGIAVVLRRCLRALLSWQDPAGVWRAWALPMAIICAGSAVVLWAPDIVPDQPWASRRLIVIAIPGLIICALWAAAWLARRARDRGARPVTAAVAGLFCAAAMLVPTVATTFGLGFSHSGKSGGLKPVVQGLALTRTGAGQIAAIRDLCAQIPRNSSVVIVDSTTAQEFSEVIRGMCGVPVAWMAGRPVSAVDSVINSIAAAGRRPLLLAGTQRRLAVFGGVPVRALDLRTTEDPHQLTQLPTSPQSVRYQVWLTVPGTSGVGT